MPAEATTEHEHPETVPDQPIGELILSLRGGNYDDKVLRLRSANCTLGSGEDCMVQVADAAPLQCVILRGPTGTVARDWTGGSRLNLEPFSDSPLAVGDRLQIGSVEVKILADCRAEAAETACRSAVRQPSVAGTEHEGAVGFGNGEDVPSRFDRVEGRLASLERMVRELIHLKREPPATDGRAAPQPEPEAAPAPRNQAGVANIPAVTEAASPTADPQSAELPLWARRGDDEELDGSVRDYIERLLRQVTANPPETPPVADCVAAVERPSVATRPDAGQECLPAAADCNLDGVPTAGWPEDSPDLEPWPSELTPLSLPPERDSNLDAMRKVANSSATAAIRTFEKHQAARKTADRLPLLLVGLLCGLMLLYLACASGDKAMFAGAAAALVGAALTAWQVLFVLRRWLVASRPVEER